MKQLKQMKETLMSAVQGQLSNLSQANTEELGCAIDMIKDLSEAIYYCTITKSMEEAEEEKKEEEKMMRYQQPQVMYYQERMKEPRYSDKRVKDPYYERDMDRWEGRMYYGGGDKHSSEPSYTNERDEREGRSGERRKTYMEARHMNTDKNIHMKELDAYAHELTNDILEMVQDASPEERQALKKKIIELSGKL